MTEDFHIILMGDSILDNAPYTGGGPAVIDQVTDLIRDFGRATLVACDGDRIRDVGSQMGQLPTDASHVVLSVGGNDALDHLHVLSEDTDTVAEVMIQFGDIASKFQSQYHQAVQRLTETGKNVTVCTIYNGGFTDPLQSKVVSAAVRMFNDAIYQVAGEFGLQVIDLRRICNRPEDYANPIEPSSIGGDKIARAIVEVCLRPE